MDATYGALRRLLQGAARPCHVFLAGIVPAKSLVDLTEPGQC